MDLGASPWMTFRQITLPLIAPGIWAGALIAFTLSLDDVIIRFSRRGRARRRCRCTSSRWFASV